MTNMKCFESKSDFAFIKSRGTLHSKAVLVFQGQKVHLQTKLKLPVEQQMEVKVSDYRLQEQRTDCQV